MAKRRKKAAVKKGWKGGDREVIRVSVLRRQDGRTSFYDDSGNSQDLVSELALNPTSTYASDEAGGDDVKSKFSIWGYAGCGRGAALTDNPDEVPAIIDFLASCIGKTVTLTDLPKPKA